MVYVWVVYGLCLGCLWLIFELFMVYVWVVYGLCLGCLWLTFGLLMVDVWVVFESSSLIPVLFRSCRMVSTQAFIGLPFGHITFLRFSSNAFLAGVARCSRTNLTM